MALNFCLAPKKYEIGCSNEVLNFSFIQAVAEISKVKIYLQPLNQNPSLVHHLKDLFHICLEPEDQDDSRTLKITLSSQITLTLLHKEAKNERRCIAVESVDS